MITTTEIFIQEKLNFLDETISKQLNKRYWIIYVGIIAVFLSLIVNTPILSLYTHATDHWSSKVFEAQVNHPFTPIQIEEYNPPSSDYGITSHLDKIAFRITVPILGHIFHTGAYSWILFNVISGFLFFPLLVSVIYRYSKNKLLATYITLAFAMSYTGSRFFNDNGFCDGLAWLFLLIPLLYTNIYSVFFCILFASFVDERALIASASIPLFFIVNSNQKKQSIFSLIKVNSRIVITSAVAWLVYFVLRYYLSNTFNLHTGTTMLLTKSILWYHAQKSIPYGIICVFQILWIWFFLGFIYLYTSKHWTVSVSYTFIFILLFFTSIIVFDIERSLGYCFTLLLSCILMDSVSIKTKIKLSRLSFLGGFFLIVPFNTVIRYLNHI